MKPPNKGQQFLSTIGVLSSEVKYIFDGKISPLLTVALKERYIVYIP